MYMYVYLELHINTQDFYLFMKVKMDTKFSYLKKDDIILNT